MYNHTNNICSPILALTPFTETIIRTGEQGEVGLSGPNIELLSFNSGDSTLTIVIPYIVGSGLATPSIAVDPILIAQLGIVINQTGTLSNFEIGYSGRIVRSSNATDRIRYILTVVRSLNNSGIDYTIQDYIEVFFGELRFPTISPFASPQEISANRLITIPFSLPNVNSGDKVVLVVQLLTAVIGSILEFTSLDVQASVHFTPSV